MASIAGIQPNFTNPLLKALQTASGVSQLKTAVQQRDLAEQNMGLQQQNADTRQKMLDYQMAQPPADIRSLNYAYNEASQLPDNDPRKKMLLDYVNKRTALANGFQVAQTPNGWTITEGGAVPLGGNTQTPGSTGQSIPQTPGSTGQSNGLVQAPGSPHGKYSNEGATLHDTNTGNDVSVPTKAVVTNMQNTNVAERTASSGLNQYAKDILPYVGLNPGKTKNWLETFFGEESPSYDRYRAAIQTGIPHMADNMLQVLGLNKTNDLYNNMVKSLTPGLSDSKGTYSRRIATSLAEGLIRQKKYNQIMKYGIPLQLGKPEEIENNSGKRRQLIDTLQGQILGHAETHSNNADLLNRIRAMGY